MNQILLMKKSARGSMPWGFLMVILGLFAMIWKGWPVSGLWAVGILVGVKLVVGGMVMMAIESVGDSVRKDLG